MTSVRQPICVEVVHVLPAGASRVTLSLPDGATVSDALGAALGDRQFAGIDIEQSAVGVFGRLAQRSDALRDGDRVEIYRGPAADAKAARRARLKPPRR